MIHNLRGFQGQATDIMPARPENHEPEKRLNENLRQNTSTNQEDRGCMERETPTAEMAKDFGLIGQSDRERRRTPPAKP